MGLLNEADEVAWGTEGVDRVFMDGVMVWPPPSATSRPLVDVLPELFFPVVLAANPPPPLPPPIIPSTPLVGPTDPFFPVSLYPPQIGP